MGRNHDGSLPENTKRDADDRDIRRKSSREKASVSEKDSGEEKDVKAQAMKEQARLKEEMVYLYKIGDMEGAAAIQRRLDPDVPM